MVLAFLLVIAGPLLSGGTHAAESAFAVLIAVALSVLALSAGSRFAATRGALIAAGLFSASLLMGWLMAGYQYVAWHWVVVWAAALLTGFAARELAQASPLVPEAIDIAFLIFLLTHAVISTLSGGVVRNAGSFTNPNDFALACAIASSAGFERMIAWLADKKLPAGWRSRHENSSRDADFPWLALANTGIGAMLVLLTASRGGAVALAAGYAAAILAHLRFRVAVPALGLTGAVVLSALILIPNPLSGRIRELSEGKDIFAWDRTFIWKQGLITIRENPLGVGLGNYRYAAEQYAQPTSNPYVQYSRRAATPHNLFLHYAAETGIPGLLLALAALGILIRRIWKSGGGPRLLAVFVPFAVHGQFADPFAHEWMLVVTGLLTGLASSQPPADEKRIEAPVRWAWAGLTLLSLLMIYWSFAAVISIWSMDRAQKKLAAGDSGGAIEEMAGALNFAPTNARLHLSLGALFLSLHKQHKTPKAIESAEGRYKRAALLNPRSDEAWLGLAETYHAALRQTREPMYVSLAEENYRKALALNPTHVIIRLALAKLLAAAGENQKALDEADRALAIERNHFAAHDLKYRLLWDTGRRREAVDGLAKAIALAEGLDYHPSVDTEPYSHEVLQVDLPAWKNLLADWRNKLQ
ncbi:MAG: hypothetical protein GMKNLPBB_00844 [Myxococcota bacterium]|nr:hypothetical protein [Myxococcota bacterium]